MAASATALTSLREGVSVVVVATLLMAMRLAIMEDTGSAEYIRFPI